VKEPGEEKKEESRIVESSRRMKQEGPLARLEGEDGYRPQGKRIGEGGNKPFLP